MSEVEAPARPQTILVTGANGLIGYDLACRLQDAGRRVVAVDRNVADIGKVVEAAFEVEIGDVHRLHELAGRYGIDAVVHCGGVSGPMLGKDNPAQLFNVNVGGTIDVAEVARQVTRRTGRCRLVFCSSLTVYGDHPADDIREDAPLRNRTSYPASKIAGEAIMLAYAQEHGVDAVIMRIAGVYGPRRRTACVIRLMISDALDGGPTVLPYGKGFPRQWVYIDDVVQGLMLAVDAPDPAQKIYNLSGGINPPIDEAASIIREMIPAAMIDLASGPDPDDVTLGLLNIDAARRELGYMPKISLRDGIRRMVDHWLWRSGDSRQTDMKPISIVGAGQAGCILAYALIKKGYPVTLYSDKTPEQWLNHSAPTGSACLYAEVIDIERELGMDFWSDSMFPAEGVLLESARFPGDPEAGVLRGRLEYGRKGGAIDQRLRIHRWLSDIESIGGKLVIESVTPERMDQIALESSLTILAAGKADLGRIIPRDDRRSHYDKPQRHLAMTIVRSKSGRHVADWFSDRIGYSATKFDFFADSGEYFWVPYNHKTAGPTYCILYEARPGGAMDRFAGAASGEEVTNRAKQIIRDFAPWEHHVVDDIEYVSEDPHGWLVGRFAPQVRQPFGRLPSGGLVMSVGDTAITFDPLCGQGGNFASRSAKFIAEEIAVRGEGPFDELWMTEVNWSLWAKYGRNASELTKLFLEPAGEAASLVIQTAGSDERAADDYYYGFPHPEAIVPALTDMNVARAFANRYTT